MLDCNPIFHSEDLGLVNSKFWLKRKDLRALMNGGRLRLVSASLTPSSSQRVHGVIC